MNAEEFNSCISVGEEVIYINDLGQREETKTRSIAWDVCGNALVKLEGKVGGYIVDRVRPL